MRSGLPARSNRLYQIHYPDGTVHEPYIPQTDNTLVIRCMMDFYCTAGSELRRECDPHPAVFTSTGENTGNRAVAFACGEKLLQSDPFYITVIVDPAG